MAVLLNSQFILFIMGQLFQSLQILNENGLQNQATDILIDNGIIVAIGQNLSANGHEVVDAKNWIVSLGWKDCFTVCRVPGSEHKDTLTSLVKSAHLGGYTELLLVSGGTTALDSAVKVEFIVQNFKNQDIKIHPSGTISYKQEGKEITEMYDMFLSGAKFFTDGIQHLKNPELLKRALLYTQTFDSKLMVYSEDSYMSENGMVNEGEVSAVLGMKTRPALAEEIAVIRNIYIAEYTNRAVHLSGISSAKSVEIIREAKQKGINVTADVSIANLFYTDEVLKEFDTQYKVLPVIRTAKDKEALWQGVLDGTIDLVASHHSPQDNESKDCEFDLADFGSSNLEFTAAALWKICNGNTAKFYELLYTKPTQFLNQSTQKLEVGTVANLSFFAIENQNIQTNSLKGPSKSSVFIKEILPLTIKGVCVEGKFIAN
ncbi:MAG: hypothetical protein RLZZ414_394 [Bacteroidota bacterium]|jgi:dihydroorotase